MAHTNSTPNYNLPQFVSSDKPAWLTDVNAAYSAIDTGMKNAQDAADDAQSDATQALLDSSSAMSTAASADAKASGTISSISDVFDPTATYEAGDIVIYNNLLYRCILDVTTPGPWTGTANWSRTSITALLNNKQAKIESLPSGTPSSNSVVPILTDGSEGKASIDDMFGALDLFKLSPVLTGSSSEIPGGGWADSNITTPDITGYTPIAFIMMQPSSPTFSYIIGSDLPGRSIRIANKNTSAMSLYATCRVLYVKSNAF